MEVGLHVTSFLNGVEKRFFELLEPSQCAIIQYYVLENKVLNDMFDILDLKFKKFENLIRAGCEILQDCIFF